MSRFPVNYWRVGLRVVKKNVFVSCVFCVMSERTLTDVTCPSVNTQPSFLFFSTCSNFISIILVYWPSACFSHQAILVLKVISWSSHRTRSVHHLSQCLFWVCVGFCGLDSFFLSYPQHSSELFRPLGLFSVLFYVFLFMIELF